VASGIYSVAAAVATPTFNPAGYNIYPAISKTVTISTTTTGAQMRYTTNGTTPTSTSGTLIAGISGSATVTPTITTPMTLKAIAFKSGMSNSAVRSDTYTRENPTQGPVGAATPLSGSAENLFVSSDASIARAGSAPVTFAVDKYLSRVASTAPRPSSVRTVATANSPREQFMLAAADATDSGAGMMLAPMGDIASPT
jgi:hypothetical protein